MKNILTFVMLFLASLSLEAKNPIDSPTFDYIIKNTIGEDKYIFDDKNIKIKVPSFADNPIQVPIFVDASKIKNVKKMIILADLNPIPIVLSMVPNKFLPIISTNMKVAQETPLRVLVLNENNVWHIGSANIKSNGGGCDVTSLAAANDTLSDNLGKNKGKIFNKEDKKRVKFSIFHPMETGLVFGAVAFYLEKIEIKDENNNLLTSFETTAAMSENPRLNLQSTASFEKLNILFADNDSNEFELQLP